MILVRHAMSSDLKNAKPDMTASSGAFRAGRRIASGWRAIARLASPATTCPMGRV
jgi:hypothetical protein